MPAPGRKWGNRATVREQVARVVEKPRAEPVTLETLLAGLTEENRHSEIDWGAPVGGEAW
ncbi:MAG: PbsX family transcriptional regulator [Alphaproteobacteria bacterium]|nr:MAG: PbsX family transcriptional regulator [Alphaproteobacteria bacterium]